MRRSKLEMQVDILKALAQHGPLQITRIMDQTNVSSGILKESLNFLIKQGLIEEVPLKKKATGYANTNRGAAVVRFFGGLGKKLESEAENKFAQVSY